MVMALSFYTVFSINLAVTKMVYDQSIRLKKQQKWFRAEKNAVDQAFSWAHAMMYDYQTRKKAVIASL